MNDLYELIDLQPDFVLVYKKPGASFHSETGEPGVFETVKQDLQLGQLFPVHRLDKMTSGLLLMARTEEANRSLCEQFGGREIEKYYLAISAYKPSKKQGRVAGDMQVARRGTWKLCHSQHNPAVTQFFSQSIGQGLRLFILKPHTGKTHQLRVALKSLGAVILGDQRYGDKSQVDRGYLHAYSLAFALRGKTYRYTVAPREGQHFLSAEFALGVEPYAQPWELNWPNLGGDSGLKQPEAAGEGQ